MTDNSPDDKPKSSTARKAAIGAAATIGSAAVAAALLYAGKKMAKKGEDKADHAPKIPSGENPETD